MKNVLITENSKEICPEWLSFLTGIIETDDIPLNISRENLQQNDKVLLLKKQFIKKTIDFLKDLMIEDFELYKQIYSRYGKFIKFGIRDEDDIDNIDKLKDLLIFNSLQSDKDNLITLCIGFTIKRIHIMWLKIHTNSTIYRIFAIAFSNFIHGFIQLYLLYIFFK